MYMIPDMIDMGLRDGQKWPTKEHRAVAQVLFLANSQVTTKDQLMEAVSSILVIPANRIRTVTADEIVDEFHVPYVSRVQNKTSLGPCSWLKPGGNPNQE